MISSLLATLALGAPTVLLAAHALGVASRSRRPASPNQPADPPLIDTSRVSLGFAVSLISVAVGRQVADHHLFRGIELSSLVYFCSVIAWGIWAQGERSRWSPTVVLIATSITSGLLGATEQSW